MRAKTERQNISTGRSVSIFSLFFCAVAWAFVPFFDARFGFIYFFISWEPAAFSCCGGFPHESFGWRLLFSAESDGEERESQKEREAEYRNSPVPCDATTLPGQARHRSFRLYAGRPGADTSCCVMWVAHQMFGLSFCSRICFAAITTSRDD